MFYLVPTSKLVVKMLLISKVQPKVPPVYRMELWYDVKASTLPLWSATKTPSTTTRNSSFYNDMLVTMSYHH